MRKTAVVKMGNTEIAVEGMLKKMNLTPVNLKTTKTTLKKGLAIAPEFSCFPFKTIIGMLIDAVESGVDLFVIPTDCSIRGCQSADFAMAAKFILQKKGYKNFDIIYLENANPYLVHKRFKEHIDVSLKAVAEALLTFSQKLYLLNDISEYTKKLLFSVPKDEAEAFRKKWERVLRNTQSNVELYTLSSKISEDYVRFPHAQFDDMIKVGIIGDVYSVNDNYLNNNINQRLIEYGVYPDNGITIVEMLNYHKQNEYRIAAKKYLRHNLGGLSQHTIAKAIEYSKKNYDGIIHIFPFGCSPEIVVRAILPKVSKDHSIPILYLPIDEQSGDAGFTTRLEAFIDLIKLRRRR